MSNKRITDLTELTTPTTDDVFPVVDIATNTTTKVQLANLPVQTAVTTALATKQATLVSGTNIKTVNSTTLLGSGDIAVQPTLVSGTSIKTVNSNSLLGAGDVAVQETLISGTNIKTLNSVSLLGAGNIVLAATPSGVAGAIQFSNGSAFASDAANLFWDDTNNRLGIGTNAPSATAFIKGDNATYGGTPSIKIQNSLGATHFEIKNNGLVSLLDGIIDVTSANTYFLATQNTIGSSTSLGARLGIKGSGATSATTSLLVQDSTGAETFRVNDVGNFGKVTPTSTGIFYIAGGSGSTSAAFFQNGLSNFNGFRIQMNAQTLIDEAGANAFVTSSAILELKATTKGFLPPRMTTTQRDAIVTPATGLKIYNTTLGTTDTYDGASWQRFGQQTLIKGSGSTSATTSLLVQNSAGSNLLRIRDDGNIFCEGGGAFSSVGIIGTAYGLFGGASYIASASLVCGGTTQGFLPPRMTTTQKNAIASPATGLVVYDSTTNKLQCYNGSTWNDLF